MVALENAVKSRAMETAFETPRSFGSLPDIVEAIEHRMIPEALRELGGNKRKGQAPSLSRQRMIKKLKRLGM